MLSDSWSLVQLTMLYFCPRPPWYFATRSPKLQHNKPLILTKQVISKCRLEPNMIIEVSKQKLFSLCSGDLGRYLTNEIALATGILCINHSVTHLFSGAIFQHIHAFFFFFTRIHTKMLEMGLQYSSHSNHKTTLRESVGTNCRLFAERNWVRLLSKNEIQHQPT